MSKKRLLYLDNLKVCLTVLVIFHHAGQAYGDGGDWAYHPSNPAEFMPWIWHFFAVNAAHLAGQDDSRSEESIMITRESMK